MNLPSSIHSQRVSFQSCHMVAPWGTETNKPVGYFIGGNRSIWRHNKTHGNDIRPQKTGKWEAGRLIENWGGGNEAAYFCFQWPQPGAPTGPWGGRNKASDKYLNYLPCPRDSIKYQASDKWNIQQWLSLFFLLFPHIRLVWESKGMSTQLQEAMWLNRKFPGAL